jgi:hypothetical protein
MRPPIFLSWDSGAQSKLIAMPLTLKLYPGEPCKQMNNTLRVMQRGNRSRNINFGPKQDDLSLDRHT